MAMYTPQDESLSDWAQRRVEEDMRNATLKAMESLVPQTPPVGQAALIASLSGLAELLAILESTKGPVTTPPPEIAEVLGRLRTDIDFVYSWAEVEATNG